MKRRNDALLVLINPNKAAKFISMAMNIRKYTEYINVSAGMSGIRKQQVKRMAKPLKILS
jgi:hypothetical protein